MVAAAAHVPYHIPFGGSAQLQYAPDVGEAFARAAQLGYEGASVHNLGGPVIAIADLVALIDDAVSGGSGLITASEQALPFPSEVDGASFVELLGGSVMRPIGAGVTDAIGRFERLLAEGLVHAPEPPTAAPSR
jgi:hypothetical protein